MAELSKAEELIWALQQRVLQLQGENGELSLLLAAVAGRDTGPVILPDAELRRAHGRVLRIAASTSGDAIVWVEDA
jgi:hypothetical protein